MLVERGAQSMMNNRSKTSHNGYAINPSYHPPLVICETMHHIPDAETFLVIEYQPSKQIGFSYFTAMAFYDMITSDLERILWPYHLSNKVSLASFCLCFNFLCRAI